MRSGCGIAAPSAASSFFKFDAQGVIRDWLDALQWSNKVRAAVDVDPYSFL